MQIKCLLNSPIKQVTGHLLEPRSPLEGKERTGSVHCPIQIGSPIFPPASPISEVNSNKVKADSNTSNCSLSQGVKNLWPRSAQCGPLSLDTGNSPDPMLLKTMSGKRKPASENLLSLGLGPSKGTVRPIGKRLKTMLDQETWTRLNQTYTSAITLTSAEYGWTLYNQLLWTDVVQFFGARLGLESHIEPGLSQEMTVILRIRVQSSGAATSIRMLLLSMSLEELSISRICSAGLTDILSEWKSKDPRSHSPRLNLLSRRTYIRENGTRSLIPQHLLHLKEDLELSK